MMFMMKTVKMSRLATLEETRNRDFDREFWKQVDASQKFAAAWQMVQTFLAMRGRSDEQRLCRTTASFRKL